MVGHLSVHTRFCMYIIVLRTHRLWPCFPIVRARNVSRLRYPVTLHLVLCFVVVSLFRLAIPQHIRTLAIGHFSRSQSVALMDRVYIPALYEIVQIADGTDGVDIYVVSVVICALAPTMPPRSLFFFFGRRNQIKKIPNPQLNSPRRSVDHLRASVCDLLMCCR
jgi:hypothetical protein